MIPAFPEKQSLSGPYSPSGQACLWPQRHPFSWNRGLGLSGQPSAAAWGFLFSARAPRWLKPQNSPQTPYPLPRQLGPDTFGESNVRRTGWERKDYGSQSCIQPFASHPSRKMEAFRSVLCFSGPTGLLSLSPSRSLYLPGLGTLCIGHFRLLINNDASAVAPPAPFPGLCGHILFT